MLWSVRFALLDAPSLVLIACAVGAVEAGRPVFSAAIAGLAGLVALAILPLLIWEDYLRSIYRSTITAGAEPHMVMSGRVLATRFLQTLTELRNAGVTSGAWLPFGVVSSVIVQAIYLRRDHTRITAAHRPLQYSARARAAAGPVLVVVRRRQSSPAVGDAGHAPVRTGEGPATHLSRFRPV